MDATLPPLPIALPMDAIEAFCRKHRIRTLSLFGSVLRDDFTPESDIDVLVEFEPGHRPGLAFFALGDELETLLGRPVDLFTAAWLHEAFVEDVQRAARPVYVAA